MNDLATANYTLARDHFVPEMDTAEIEKKFHKKMNEKMDTTLLCNILKNARIDYAVYNGKVIVKENGRLYNLSSWTKARLRLWLGF